MIRIISGWLFFFSLMFSVQAFACTIEVDITDVIGPATVDLLQRVEKFATQEKCTSILLLINTPGGSLDSTRTIVEEILNSPFPYLCLVSPSGGRAGSAGAIILQACHVNGGVHGTNLGAATPVAMGQELPKDLRNKIMNDTRSWLESLTKLRGRSERFGKDIILEAKSVTAEEALRLKALDFAGGKEEFLKFAEGREVKMPGDKSVKVKTGALKVFGLDTRYKVVSFLTDPELAYLLLMGSLALIYFEITHPGTMVAGVTGGIGLIIALVALNKLDVEWGGLGLIFLGLALLVAEIFLPTFGIVGIGGLISFILGSVFLFDPVKTGGYQLPLYVILPVAFLFTLVFLAVSYLLLRTGKVKKKGGFEDIVGRKGRIVSVEGREGMLEVMGEMWSFETDHELQSDDAVTITGHRGLVLKVKRESP